MSDAEQRARNSLMTACMAAAGYPYEPELIGVNAMAPAEDEVAAVRAWRAAVDANAALPGYREAEEGPDGCLGQTFDRMYPVPEQRSAVLMAALQYEASGEIRDRIYADAEYLADLAGLAACLAEQGYEVDATLDDPERTDEQIAAVRDALAEPAEPVTDEYEFVPDMIAAADAPMNAICPMFSDVVRTSFAAANRRAGDAWLAEHPERLVPIRDVMVSEYERFIALIDSAPLVVELGGQLIEVSVTPDGAGLCGRFLPGGEAGCDTIDPAKPSVFVWVSTDNDTRLVLYGFMPSGWDAWLEVGGVRTEVSRSRPGGAERVAIAAALPLRTEAGVVEMVQVDEGGSVVRTTIER